jgi:hypothetical protein
MTANCGAPRLSRPFSRVLSILLVVILIDFAAAVTLAPVVVLATGMWRDIASCAMVGLTSIAAAVGVVASSIRSRLVVEAARSQSNSDG